ncbi:MAG: OmpP1/FadL family transporter [Pseudomonadota bacterium]
MSWGVARDNDTQTRKIILSGNPEEVSGMTMKRTMLGVAVAVAAASSSSVHATNGYFQHGYGVKSMGMGGSGVAFANNTAMNMATNPAALTEVDDQVMFDVSFFRPVRGYDYETRYDNNNMVALLFGGEVSGSHRGSGDSDRESFYIPSLAFSYGLTDKDAIGLAVYGNGGMNTDYPAESGSYLGFGAESVDEPGTYGAGRAGVDLEQMFITPTYARSLLDDRLSIGISGLIVRQKFSARGLENFNGEGPIPQMMASYGMNFPSFSTDNEHMTGNGHDKAWGYGGKIGITYHPIDRLSLGASYQTKVQMDEFDEYSGLFAEGGNFDIPPTWTLGMAAGLTDDLTVTFDYQRIEYSDVKSISNPSNEYLFDCMEGNRSRCLGGEDGAGFGWDDINVYKLGVQWQPTANLQLRAGWNRGDNPISSEDALFNSIAPGVVEDHYTAGVSYAFNENHELHGAFMYAPEVTVDGENPLLTELADQYFGADYEQDLTIRMKQYEATVGYTYRF